MPAQLYTQVSPSSSSGSVTSSYVFFFLKLSLQSSTHLSWSHADFVPLGIQNRVNCLDFPCDKHGELGTPQNRALFSWKFLKLSVGKAWQCVLNPIPSRNLKPDLKKGCSGDRSLQWNEIHWELLNINHIWLRKFLSWQRLIARSVQGGFGFVGFFFCVCGSPVLIVVLEQKLLFCMVRDKGAYLVQEAECAHSSQESTFTSFSAWGDSDLHSQKSPNYQRRIWGSLD